MATKMSYLVCSETGFYEYRRRVPAKLRQHFPRNSKGKLMWEWKQALNTKLEAVARRRWVKENERFGAAKDLAQQVLQGVPLTEAQLQQSALSAANRTAIEFGVHPDQAPTLTVDATEEEIQAFPSIDKAWNDKVKHHQEILAEFIHDSYVDDAQWQDDDRSGISKTAGYQIPYNPKDPNDPLIIQDNIVSGRTALTSKPTCARGHHPDGPTANHALTFKLDHSSGAAHQIDTARL